MGETTGSALAIVIADSHGKLSGPARDQLDRIKTHNHENGTFLKTLTGEWPDYFKRRLKEDGVRSDLSYARSMISDDQPEVAKTAIDGAVARTNALKSEIARNIPKEQKWAAQLGGTTPSPAYLAELEDASGKFEAIFDACRKAYFAAIKAFGNAKVGDKPTSPGRAELTDASTKSKTINDAVVRVYEEIKKRFYPAQWSDELTGRAEDEGSYPWFEAQKKAIDEQAAREFPPTKTVTPHVPTQEELDWDAVRNDVIAAYTSFKTNASAATLPAWHALRGPYMTAGLYTEPVRTIYFLMNKSYMIGGKTYVVSSSETSGLSLKTTIPNALLRAGAPNAVSFIYHRRA